MKKEIKTELVCIANEKTNETKRKAKAKEYSAYCNRKHRIKHSLKIATAVVGCGFLLGGLYIVGENDIATLKAEGKIKEEVTKTVAIETETIPATETETRTISAVLFDIDDSTGDYILQTEDGHLWGVQDAPEVVYSVTFDTKGTVSVDDDEIVGLEE